MAEFPAIPLWTDAYLADTGHLTTIEHGAYLLLLMTMWRAGGKLPNDDKLLARYTRLTPAQWQRIKPSLMPFFRISSDSITQGRLTDELNVVRQKSVKASDSARARWLKTNETDDANASPEQCERNATTPTTTYKKEDTNVSSKKGSRLKPDFSLPKTWGDWAMIEGMTEEQVRLEADRFRDYWIAKTGKDATKADWLATWRNWCRKALENPFGPKGRNDDRPTPREQRAEDRLRGDLDFADSLDRNRK